MTCNGQLCFPWGRHWRKGKGGELDGRSGLGTGEGRVERYAESFT